MISLSLVLMMLFIAIIGVSAAIIFSLIPGLHIYSILGFVVLFTLTAQLPALDPLVFSALTVSMLIGYSLGSNISAVYFQTPDDSSVFMVFPSQKYLQDRRGYEAVYLTGMGAVVGSFIAVVLIMGAADFLVNLVKLMTPNSLWIIATAMVFVWMSEWPKDPARQESKWAKLGAAWLQLGMGLFMLIASGILGILLFFSQLVPPERSYQGLAAAFVGLFALPSLVQGLVSSKEDIPKQHEGKSIEGDAGELFQGAAAGIIGGSIGMLIPSLTAGVGNSFSRHAVAQAGDRSFMFSQGVSRSIYYVGAVLLLFIPGVTIRRGGAALFISLFYLPQTEGELLIISAIVLIAAAVGWFVFVIITKIFTRTIHKIPTKFISAFGLIIMTSATYYMLGIAGIFISIVATAIGYIPLVFNTRRVYGIGVITIPMMISMGGWALIVSQFFGIA